MAKRKNIKVGDRFGKLVVIKEVEPNVTPCAQNNVSFCVSVNAGIMLLGI